MARDDAFPDEGGIDRRTFMKAAIGLGAAGLTGSLVASGKTLLPPPIQAQGEVNEAFVYAKGDQPSPFGFDRLVGREARVDDFAEPWVGAAVLWRALFDEDNNQIPGTGFPVLLIRVERDLFQYPAEWTPGEDFVDEEDTGVSIVAIWDRCVHLCCFPQWHLERLPAAYQDYDAERVPRTLLAGEDPIWCRCHNSQYDPVTFVWDVHPNGALYIGSNLAHGPATRGLPAVSMRDQGGRLVGTRFLADAPVPPADVQERIGGRVAPIYRDWYFAYCR